MPKFSDLEKAIIILDTLYAHAILCVLPEDLGAKFGFEKDMYYHITQRDLEHGYLQLKEDGRHYLTNGGDNHRYDTRRTAASQMDHGELVQYFLKFRVNVTSQNLLHPNDSGGIDTRKICNKLVAVAPPVDADAE